MNTDANIKLCHIDDLNEIFRLYALATAYQKKYITAIWPTFDREMVQREIEQQRQYKFMIDKHVACVFAVAFSDPEIWFEKDKESALYIHRIAANPAFRGQHFVKQIVAWGKEYAFSHQLYYIRMDTTAGNTRLINYYQDCGFDYLGEVQLGISDLLPAHYQNASMSLFEIKIDHDSVR